jgi:hypothetical protein
MPTVYDLTREQLTERLLEWGEPAFRAKQLWTQLWKRAATYEGQTRGREASRHHPAGSHQRGLHGHG